MRPTMNAIKSNRQGVTTSFTVKPRKINPWSTTVNKAEPRAKPVANTSNMLIA
jgi:hypothetical protein